MSEDFICSCGYSRDENGNSIGWSDSSCVKCKYRYPDVRTAALVKKLVTWHRYDLQNPEPEVRVGIANDILSVLDALDPQVLDLVEAGIQLRRDQA